MLPKKLRFWLFEALSLRTMRYVHAIPRRKATGLVAQVYDMIEEDFFINGSLISRSKVPELMAGIWTAGRCEERFIRILAWASFCGAQVRPAHR